MIDNFKYWTPIELVKGKGKKKGKMIVKGIASTSKRDTDEEILQPSGFVLDRLMSSGFLNWNHKANTDPEAIIGEPIKAEVTSNNELYIEGELYENSPLARKVYDLAEVLQRNSSGRRLGYSIEGKALERDSVDKRIVTKALITGIAITPTPKNPGTVLELKKGESYDYEDMDSGTGNGGSIYIVDVTGDDGLRRTVDKDLNIKIERAITTESISPATPESVEGASHKKKKIKNQEFSEKKLSKSEVYKKIFDNFTEDIEKARKIYSLMEGIVDKTKGPNSGITEEDIQKALNILDMVKGEGAPDQGKGSESKEKEQENSEKELEKGESSEDKKEDKVEKSSHEDGDEPKKEMSKADMMGEMMSKMMSMMGEMQKMYTAKDTSQPGASMDGVKEVDQGQSNKDGDMHMFKSDVDELSKSLQDSKSDIQEMIKGLESNLGEKFSAVSTLLGSERERNTELAKSIDGVKLVTDELKRRLNIVEKSPAHTGKSVLTKGDLADRFDAEGAKESDSETYSMSKDRQRLSDRLYSLSNIEKGENVDNNLVKAVQNLESSGTIGGVGHEIEALRKHIAGKYNINIVN